MRCCDSILKSPEQDTNYEFSVNYDFNHHKWLIDDFTSKILHAACVSVWTMAMFSSLTVTCMWSSKKKEMRFILCTIFLHRENQQVPRGSGMMHAVLQGLKMGILHCKASEAIILKNWNIQLSVSQPSYRTTMAYVRKQESFPKSINKNITFGMVTWTLCKTMDFEEGGWYWKVACDFVHTDEQEKQKAQKQIETYNEDLFEKISPAELIPRDKITFSAESLVAEQVLTLVKNEAVILLDYAFQVMLQDAQTKYHAIDLCKKRNNPVLQAVFTSLHASFSVHTRTFLIETPDAQARSRFCGSFELHMMYRPAFQYIDLLLEIMFALLDYCKLSIRKENDILFKSMTVTQSSAPGNNPRSITHTFLANSDDDYDTQTPTNELGCLMCSRRYVDLRI
jgi:hypothetical protein